jgi:hypothetical protein
MRIKLSDPALLGDLVTFLRNEGYVAYYEGSGVEAVRPRSFGEREAEEIRAIVGRWRNEHPETLIEVED